MKIIPATVELIDSINGQQILKKIELCGRTAYKSEDRITEDSAQTFVRNIIKSGHESVLEHYSISVRFINDRGVSHEEVRHRITSPTQESTRFCNYSNDKFGNEITYIDIRPGMWRDPKVSQLNTAAFTAIFDEWMQACIDAERHYNRMIELGATPQIARSVLNNSTKTEIVITTNLREWRHFLKLRCSPAAHPQMREVAIMLLRIFKEQIPVIFDDIDY